MMKLSEHKKLLLVGGIVILLLLLADMAMTSLGVGTWIGSMAKYNSMHMCALLSKIEYYKEKKKEFPGNLYDLSQTNFCKEKDLSDWVDREATANLLLLKWIKKTFLARHHIYLYFPPQKTAAGYQDEPEAIILAEPYSQFGKRYVYRQKDLLEMSPNPKLIAEAEFQRQTQNK